VKQQLACNTGTDFGLKVRGSNTTYHSKFGADTPAAREIPLDYPPVKAEQNDAHEEGTSSEQ